MVGRESLRKAGSGRWAIGLQLAGLLLAGQLLLLGACRRDTYDYLGRLEGMEAGRQGERALSRDRTRELEREIARYRRIVEQKVGAHGKLEVYYKMLASRYLDRQMFGEAYRNLQEAIAISPANPTLFYLAGVSAAQVARSQAQGPERARWLSLAQTRYRQALELNSGYSDALYGLAVLLVFERGEEGEAQQERALLEAGQLVERLLADETQNIDALFLKGQIDYRLGDLERAMETYDRIARLTRIPQKREEALRNKGRIEEELRGH